MSTETPEDREAMLKEMGVTNHVGPENVTQAVNSITAWLIEHGEKLRGLADRVEELEHQQKGG